MQIPKMIHNRGTGISLLVKNIQSNFEEFVQRGTVNEKEFKAKTAWDTNEFGFYELNRNAIFIMEDI